MERYKPVMSFDEAAAEVYDDVSQRGDEMETVAFLEQLAREGPRAGTCHRHGADRATVSRSGHPRRRYRFLFYHGRQVAR